MGNQAVIVIHTDETQMQAIKNDPEFGKNLVEAIRKLGYQETTRDDMEREVRVALNNGGTMQVGEIVCNHSMEKITLIQSSGGKARVVSWIGQESRADKLKGYKVLRESDREACYYEVRTPGDGEYEYFVVPSIEQDEHNGEYDPLDLKDALECARSRRADGDKAWVTKVFKMERDIKVKKEPVNAQDDS